MKLLPVILPVMSKSSRKAVAKHRRRLRQRGVVRVEVLVPREDRATIRAIAAALLEPARSHQVRAFVRDKLSQTMTLKEFLTTMPEGIDFENLRDKNDFGREIEL